MHHCLLIAVQKPLQEKIAKKNKSVFWNRLLYYTDFCLTFLGLKFGFSEKATKFDKSVLVKKLTKTFQNKCG